MIILLFSSCKTLKYDEDMIPYSFIPENGASTLTKGDFQKIRFLENDVIYVMPAYFRESRGTFEGYRILLVSLLINNKYGFKDFGTVSSSEFGPLRLSDKSKTRSFLKGYSKFDFYKSLEAIAIKERYDRIQKDTIEIALGNLVFKFAPEKSN